ncbi:hypothetical protein SteCoe_804 [Stentor coeruleus]|uniref:Alpha-soluble NSF attachment protein n=1 Tax=Stentor coeruleus TaxID=5963 RepID=A0A1R2D391_9CILI|nr:hypothetical protein SteCoe_804 [Stentor coeruleus]
MAEDNYSKRAKEAFAQGEKKLKPGVFGKMFSNKDDRMDEASELFKQAANFYRLAKDFQNSSAAFVKCAECKPEEAANYFSEAGNVLRKVNTAEAITYYNRAVEIMVSGGRISMAARLRKQIAEIYEADEMLGLAVENYAHAAELYEMDNGDSTANSCHLKVAELSTFESLESNVILKAIKLFEDVADRYLMHTLTRYSAKDCYFKAALLYLSNDDTIGAENATGKYSLKDPSFETSRENKLIKDLLTATRAEDVGSFENILFQFNKITPLDRWKTKVLLKAKSFINRENEEDFS